MKKSEVEIINKLNAYQHKKYCKVGGVVKLEDIRIECVDCHVWFTPSNDRVKELMNLQGHISKCKECFNGNQNT